MSFTPNAKIMDVVVTTLINCLISRMRVELFTNFSIEVVSLMNIFACAFKRLGLFYIKQQLNKNN